MGMEVDGNTNFYSARIRSISDKGEWARYERLSREKALRVRADYLSSPHDTVSSSQSRDESKEKYGGAVIFNSWGRSDSPNDIISFSGLSERADEAVSLIIGKDLGLTTPKFIEYVVRISRNEVYQELLEAFEGSRNFWRQAFETLPQAK